jgi:predicted nucleic acid-binding protein
MIHHETACKIFQNSHLLKSCSGSRMYEEICKDMKSGYLMPVFSQFDLFGILPCLLGDIGQFYSENPMLISELLNYLKSIDCMNISGKEIPIQDIFSITFWPWARHLIEGFSEGHDKSKMLHDEIIRAGLQIQIPKVVSAHIVQVLAVLNSMEQAVRTGHFRYSEKKKAHYKDASNIFGIIRGEYLNYEDPFGEFLKIKTHGTKRWRKRR